MCYLLATKIKYMVECDDNVYHFEHQNYIKFQNAMKIQSILTPV